MKSDYQKKGYLNEHFRYFHLKDSAGQELDLHFHDFDKIVLLLSGHVDYALETETFPLKPWTILLVPHHTLHKAIIDRSEPYERVIIYLSHQHFRSGLSGTDVLKCFETAKQSGRYLLSPSELEIGQLKTVLRGYESVAQDKGFGSDGLRETYLLQFLLLLGRMQSQGASDSHEAYDEKIETVLTYINEHLSEDLSVDTLADHIHLSRSYFMRYFKSQTGYTVHSYLLERRLYKAARLIREGVSVQNAAAESGFSDYSTFYRSFRTQFRVSPNKLRISQ